MRLAKETFTRLDKAVVYQPSSVPLWARHARSKADAFFFILNTYSDSVSINFTVSPISA